MWLRFLLVSFLNIVMGLFAIIVVLTYAIPEGLPSVAYRLISWVVAFILTLLFTFWAFHKHIPQQKDAIVLTAFHVVLFLLVYGAYGSTFLDRGTAAIFSLDFIVQLLVEVLAIQLIAYRMRRTKLQSMLGEGRML